MSLDVYLYEAETTTCEKCGHETPSRGRHCLFTANITHNLNKMAVAAGIYYPLWRPDEIGATKAEQLIVPLREGLARLKAEPERFKAYDSPNGWGLYVNFVPFVEKYLAACEANPTATVEVSR